MDLGLGPMWNPRVALGLRAEDKATWRCVGMTDASRRCLRPIRLCEAESINQLLDAMASQMPDQIDYDDLLQLAHICLCTEIPESHRDTQAADVIYRWTEIMATESCVLRAIRTPLPKDIGLAPHSSTRSRTLAQKRTTPLSTPIAMDASEAKTPSVRKSKTDWLLPRVERYLCSSIRSASSTTRISALESPASPPATPGTSISSSSSLQLLQPDFPPKPTDTATSFIKPDPVETHFALQHNPLASSPPIPSLYTRIDTPVTPSPCVIMQQPPSGPLARHSVPAEHQTRPQARLDEPEFQYAALQAAIAALEREHARLTWALQIFLYALQVATCVPLVLVMLAESVGVAFSDRAFSQHLHGDRTLVVEGEEERRKGSLWGRRRGHRRGQTSFGLRDWCWRADLGEEKGDERGRGKK